MVAAALVITEQPQPADFDPERYWSNRLKQNYSLAGVGWLGLHAAFNGWMYAVRRRVFRRVIGGRIDLTRAQVLDVGSGTGFYVALWQELGVPDISGSDLTAFAVERLRARFPDVTFHQLDISAAPVQLKGSYDAISVMDVLFHIVDDDKYAQAIENLAALLVPGGVLVVTENLLHRNTIRGEHQTSRSMAEIRELLRRAGLELELRRPLFVLMNTPIDSNGRLLHLTWTSIHLLGRGRLAWLVGALLYPVELALTRIVKEGPTTEIVVCRKPHTANL